MNKQTGPVTRPKLLILRGAPGSGKTTVATKTKFFAGWVTVSADQFFTKPNGSYHFDATKLQEAHNWCFNKAKEALSRGSNVVVDNTNRKLSEFKRYLEIPGVEIKVFCVDSSFTSTKQIPQHVMVRFFEEYQVYPGERYVKLDLETGFLTHSDTRSITSY